MTNPLDLGPAIEEALLGPRAGHHRAVLDLARRIDFGQDPEEWNSAFGPDSSFHTWTETTLMGRLYELTRSTLAPALARPGWRGLEVGGGNGAFWRDQELPPGELWVVDPWAEVGVRLQETVPAHVKLHFVEGLVQDVDLPQVDFVLASLVLHHIAGADEAERALHGLPGPGKLEVVRDLAQAAGPGGLVVINEADIHCDLELPSDDPLLEDRLVDSYVRRCARALVRDIEEGRGDPHRLAEIVKHWCLEEVALSSRPVTERDVYELDVARWLKIFDRAGLEVVRRGFATEWMLFHHYVLESRT